MLLGLTRSQPLWMLTGFAAAFFSPLFGSSNQAIWLSKVEPEVQGRVFATRYVIAQITSPLGLAIAGPIADHWLEPAMQPGALGAQWLGGWFGTGAGAGMAVQYTLFSGLAALVGLVGYAFPTLRHVETLVQDHDSASPQPSEAISKQL